MRRTKFTHLTPLLCGGWACMLLAPLQAREKPAAPVEQTVKRRTGKVLAWQEDEAARQAAQAQVRRILQRPLTLASAVQAALLQSRALQAELEEIGLSYADLRQARTPMNPSADIAVKLPDRTAKRPLTEWGIAQNFVDLLMIPLRSRVARDQLVATQARVAHEVMQQVAEVKKTFISLQSAMAMLEKRRQLLTAQASGLELMQKLHEAGNVPDLRLVQEQAEYSGARLAVAEAEAEVRSHREELNRLLSLWGEQTEWSVADALPPIPAQSASVRKLEQTAVANRLDLYAARYSLESTLSALGLEKAFRFVGGLDFGMAGEHEPDGANLLGPTVQLELPLFNFGGARVAKAEAQLRQGQRRFEQLAISIRSEVRQQRDLLLSRQAMAQLYRRELVPLRERAVSLTLLNYNAMLTGAFDLFAARREAIAAERALIEAERDYWLTYVELERVVGGTFALDELASDTSKNSAKLNTKNSAQAQP